MSDSTKVDFCVVGGGLIGLSVAKALTDMFAGSSVVVLEKESEVATHQSGHNSGVVHSGLYYSPGSLKARLCVEGRQATYATCEEAGIAFKMSGKLVIATDSSEIPALDELERRGRANGLVGMRRIGPDEIREIEPQATGLEALHVSEAGVADYPALASHHVTTLRRAGARIITDAGVTGISHRADGVRVATAHTQYSARIMVNCAGLHSDRIAHMAGLEPGVRIVPFRGEYYRLDPRSDHLVRALIYPVPDPRFPFLGVHFTRRVDGSVEVGPNAVLALGREHYRGVKPDWREVRAVVGYSGFRKLARRHWVSGTRELINSKSTRQYARLARRLIPSLKQADLTPGGAGVRAQAVGGAGNLVDDFVIEEAGSTVHLLNAPSPGATASIAIGRYVAARVRAVL